MNTVFNFSDFNASINLVLFIISGFFFGIFASRQSLFAMSYILNAYRKTGWDFLLSVPFLLRLFILLLTFFLFPLWFSTRTLSGTFIYFVVLLYFFSKEWRNLNKIK